MQGGWQPPPGGGGYGQQQPGGYGQQQQQGYGPQPGYPQAGFGGGYGYGQYEFNDLENGIIAKTAGRTRLWGIISVIIGALYTLSGMLFFLNPGLIAYLVIGIVGIVVGVTLLGVAKSLSAVVNTQGNDIEHMMQAMQKLGSAFLIQAVTTIIGVVLGAIVVAIAIVAVVAMAPSGGY